MLNVFQRRVGAGPSRAIRQFANGMNHGVNSGVPFFESLSDVVQFIRNEADNLDIVQLNTLAHKMPLMFRKSTRREEADVRCGDDFRRLLGIIRGHLERPSNDDNAIIKLFQSASYLCPFSISSSQHPEFRKMGELMWDHILSGKISPPPHEWIAVMMGISKFLDRDIQIGEYIKREAPALIPQFDITGCIELLRLLNMVCVPRDMESVTALFERIYELRDNLSNKNIERLLRESATVGYLPYQLAQHCRGILIDHASMFQYRQLGDSFKYIIELGLDDSKLHRKLADELKKNFDPTSDATNSSLAKALTKAQFPEKELAATLIQSVVTKDTYLNNPRFCLNVAYSICTFQLLELKQELEKSLNSIMSSNVSGGLLICLKEILESARIDFGIKVQVNESLTTEMDMRDMKFKSEMTAGLEEIMSGLDEPFRFNMSLDQKIGPYVVPYADMKEKVIIIVDRERDQFGPRIRTRQLEAMGYRVARMRMWMWRRAKFDDLKRDVLEVTLTPVAIAMGRITSAEAETRRAKRLSENELRKGSSMAEAET